jgi:hypothetical protein
MESSRSWSIDSYLNEHFDIPAKNPPSEARLRWRRAVGLVVRNRRRRFRMFSGLHALDDAQRRKILVRTVRPSATQAVELEPFSVRVAFVESRRSKQWMRVSGLGKLLGNFL